ncbi:MAG: hypothetical protein WC859_03320 [Elusimicrobiota bacterium]|jgi:hypothetical protein
MSVAGQRTVTGISGQADVTLYLLLRDHKRQGFQKLIVEGSRWEDFTLVFGDHNEDYEVKWHQRKVTHHLVRRAIGKELKKALTQADSFTVVSRSFSESLVKDHRYIRQAFQFWRHMPEKQYRRDRVVRKLMKSGWSAASIAFLSRTELLELKSTETVFSKIQEYFALEDPYYLSEGDLKSLVGRSFRALLELGRTGGSISKEDFLAELAGFKKEINVRSESFSPDVTFGKRKQALGSFLGSPTAFRSLERYLGPISSHAGLIFYVAEKLMSNSFTLPECQYFVEKVLVKKSYMRMALKLIETKWNAQRASTDYVIDFLMKHYGSLGDDLNYDDALRILAKVAHDDMGGRYEGTILGFIQNTIEKREDGRHRRLERKGWREEEHVAQIVVEYFSRTKDPDKLVKYIFATFHLIGDDFERVTETHPKVYAIIRQYLLIDPYTRLVPVLRRVAEQYDREYGARFTGYELAGGSFSQSGSEYTITDIGLVRFVFEPLFRKMNEDNPSILWRFAKRHILSQGPGRTNPVFLRRGLAPLLIEQMCQAGISDAEQRRSSRMLRNILSTRRGIPDTSETIFSCLRAAEMRKFGYDRVMELIELDARKYRRRLKGEIYPTNLFAMQCLVRLIQENYRPAVDYFVKLVQSPGFLARDRSLQPFEILSASSVADVNPGLIAELIGSDQFIEYLETLGDDIAWDKSGMLSKLIRKDFQNGTSYGRLIVQKLLAKVSPHAKVLQFLSTPVREATETDAFKTYQLFLPFLTDKKIFQTTFRENSYIRARFIWLAEPLLQQGRVAEARHLIELALDDPDPNPDDTDSYDKEIISGKDENTISTVRGTVAWLLMAFAKKSEPDLMAFAADSAFRLVDLDGSLARALGHSRADYYVRTFALLVFASLVHPTRRQMLGEEYQLKQSMLDILETIDHEVKQYQITPKATVKAIVNIFLFMRDLTPDEAMKALVFFEKYEAEGAGSLFIYFAVFRQGQFPQVPFVSDDFKMRLTVLCQSQNPFRAEIATQFWQMAREQNEGKNTSFDAVEPYWRVMFGLYDRQVFSRLYDVLKISLLWPAKYAAHLELLNAAITEEAKSLGAGIAVEAWGPPGEIARFLAEKHIQDFLDSFWVFLEGVTEHTRYYELFEWVQAYKGLPESLRSLEIHQKIENKLKDFGFLD